MGVTVTLNGTVGRSSSSKAREVLATLGIASAECLRDTYERMVIRKGALDGTPNTTLPVEIALPSGNIRALIVRTVNTASLELTYTPEVGTPQVTPLVLGDPTHPEGLLAMIGAFAGMSLTLTDVGADGTEVEIWAAAS